MWYVWGTGMVICLILTSPRLWGKEWICQHIGPWAINQIARVIACVFWMGSIPLLILTIVILKVMIAAALDEEQGSEDDHLGI